MASVKVKVDLDLVPTVEDRVQDMRRNAAGLFIALDAVAESGESGNYGDLSKEGYQTFAALARAIYADAVAVEKALTGDEPPEGKLAGPFVWPAPAVE